VKDIEGRLRDALIAAADTVDETRPRPLPARPRTRPGSAGVPHRLLMPVLAAGAIVLLLAGVVGVKGLRDEQVRRSAQQAEERMPRFFVASVPSAEGRRSRLEIRDSGSGRVLDAEPAEAGADFREVAAAADNRTFFAISERLSARCQIAISRLSVSDSGTIMRSDPVPGSDVEGTARGSGTLAVSPDGKMVSYGIGGCPESSKGGVGGSVFGVLDTGTGTRTEWLGAGTLEYAGMSWSGDGRYLFFVRTVLSDWDSVERQELRRIDLSGDAGDRAGYQLERGSTLIRGVDAPRMIAGIAAGKDGREVLTVEAGTAVPASPAPSVRGSADAWVAAADTGNLLRISAADGRVLRSRDQQGMVSFGHPLLKGDASGRYLLTNAGALDTSGDEPARPISGLADVYDADW